MVNCHLLTVILSSAISYQQLLSSSHSAFYILSLPFSPEDPHPVPHCPRFAGVCSPSPPSSRTDLHYRYYSSSCASQVLSSPVLR